MLSNISVRVDDVMKQEVEKILKENGLDLTSAIKLFLENVIVDKSIVLKMMAENDENK